MLGPQEALLVVREGWCGLLVVKLKEEAGGKKSYLGSPSSLSPLSFFLSYLVWKPEVSIRCLPLLLSLHLVFGDRSPWT